MGKPGRRRRRIGSADDREQPELLCLWPEQWEYERYAPATK
jgi:hypothetical protein